VNAFCAEHLNPYVNFHRPCLFAEEVADKKGKIRKALPARDAVMTPLGEAPRLPSAEVPQARRDARRLEGAGPRTERQRRSKALERGAATAVPFHQQTIPKRRV
jgi:hypothetical protein